MNQLRLALRAFRWRRGGSIVVLVAAALTIAAAALGPLFSAAAAESVLQDRLVQSDTADTTIAFYLKTDVSYPASVSVVVDSQNERGTVPGYGPPIAETVVETTGTPATGLAAKTKAVWRDGVCDHLVIVDGRCPEGTYEAVVSQRAAEAVGWVVGTKLTLDDLRQYDNTATGSEIATNPAVVTVVGTYRPASTADPYWAGRIYFSFYPSGDGPNTVDSVFVSKDLFPTLVHPTIGTIAADLVLSEPQELRVADVPALRAAVEGYLGPESSGPKPTTNVLSVLDDFEAERTTTALAAGVVTAQLALLAWLLLYLVVTDTSEARGSEVALAKLRGLPPRAVAAVALREPIVLLLLAAPVGLLLAYFFVTVLARAILAEGVPVVVTPGTLVAVALAFLGGLVAAVLASRRMFTRPVLEQWSQSAEPTGSGRRGIVADVVLAIVALGGFVLLATRSPSDESSAAAALGWLAPGLLVIAAGLLLVRLARPVLGSLVRATRASSRLGLFLGSRQAVRRPAGLRLAALLAVTIGLATFAVDASAAAAAGRDVRAGADVGAQQSVAVQLDPERDLVAAVEKADPEGRWAMAVADWIPSGGLSGRLLAVQPERLAAVASWSKEYGPISAEEAASLISPVLPDPVVLTGTKVRVRITSGPVQNATTTVLVAYRGTSDVPTFTLSEPLRAGTHDYTVEVPCTDQRCTLNGIALDRARDSGAADLDLTVVSVQELDGGTWKDLDAGLATSGTWRVTAYTGEATGELAFSADGLRYTAQLPAYVSPWLQYADVPSPLPLVTAEDIAPAGAALTFVDGNGRDVKAESVGANTILPYVGSRGSITGLRALTRSAQQLADDAHWAVWLGPAAPPDALERLTAAGITVDKVRTQAERREQLDREGPALALRLLLVCAIVGSLLAAGALAISVAVTGRRRSYELAALRAVGVPRRSLLRGCVLEQALLLGTGLVVGVPVGLVVARLALPLLPQTSSSTLLPLTVDIQGAAVLAFTVVTAALLLLTAVVGGIALLRQAVPDRLREVAA
ncbi:MAG: FtsX-like permease family protein [Candidatus Nanopelagicales bacterium]